MKAVMISGTDLLITKREHNIIVGSSILSIVQAVELRNRLSSFVSEIKKHEIELEKKEKKQNASK